MNPNTNKWAVEIGNEAISEAIQRIAFSYDYSWTGSKTVNFKESKFLVFNPDTKTITYTNERDYVIANISRLVLLLDDVIKLFNNPPNEMIQVAGIKITKNGDVWPSEKDCVTSELFDRLVVERDIFLGRNQPAVVEKGKLPSVRFCYKSTKGSVEKEERRILATAFNDDYLSGYDIQDGNQYKTFLTCRIWGTVSFHGFADKP